MGWSRPNGLRGAALRQKVCAKLKALGLLVAVVLLITPLRNLLMPSFLWHASWDDLHSLKLLRIHVFDLFYYIDRSPYSGDCAEVRRHLDPLLDIDLDTLPVYTEDDWRAGLDKVSGGSRSVGGQG